MSRMDRFRERERRLHRLADQADELERRLGRAVLDVFVCEGYRAAVLAYTPIFRRDLRDGRASLLNREETVAALTYWKRTSVHEARHVAARLAGRVPGCDAALERVRKALATDLNLVRPCVPGARGTRLLANAASCRDERRRRSVGSPLHLARTSTSFIENPSFLRDRDCERTIDIASTAIERDERGGLVGACVVAMGVRFQRQRGEKTWSASTLRHLPTTAITPLHRK